jgi:uncharacterized membrane protein YphA (DoxX/SURF4 family)
MKTSTIIEIIAWLFVSLFLYTGISKLMEYAVFKEQLSESPILAPIAEVVAWGLPLTEFVVSLLLFFPRYRLSGLYAALGLMVSFTCYVIAILAFSSKLPCSCGGVLEQLSWEGHIVFNSVFITFASIAIILSRRLKKTTSASGTVLSYN